MPHFDIIKQSTPPRSFRVASVMGTFDLQTNSVQEHFVGDIELPKSWNVGLIVGASGSTFKGKQRQRQRLDTKQTYQRFYIMQSHYM